MHCAKPANWINVEEVGILPHYVENRYHGWNLFGRGSSTSSLQGAYRSPPGLHCVRLYAIGGKVLVGELRPPFLVHPVQLLPWQTSGEMAPDRSS